MNGPRNYLVVWLSTALLIMSTPTAWSQSGKVTRLRAATTSAGPSNWPLLVGKQQGFFAAEGLDLELIILRGSTLQTQALLTDSVQINAYTVDTAARAVLAGGAAKIHCVEPREADLSHRDPQRHQSVG